jgi:hypothetical protein
MFEIKCSNGTNTYRLKINEKDTVKELTLKLKKFHQTDKGIIFLFKAQVIEENIYLIEYGIKSKSKITFSEDYEGGLINK